jgi:beta-lactamase class A
MLAALVLFPTLLGLAVLSCSPRLKSAPDRPAVPDYEMLRQQVGAYLNTLPGAHAVYFQDLASGQEFGINDRAPMPPASSIKLPVVLYLYQQVAAGKLNWNDRVTYNQDRDYQTGAGILQFEARDGHTFSLRSLATICITISDNVALNMLVRHLGQDSVTAWLKSIVPDTEHPFGNGPSTAHDLGAFLEELIRFSRQQPEVGGQLLNDLAHTIYHVGLPGKLPPELVVSHKEGSMQGVATDAGIVFGRRPYILVVMSEDLPYTDEEEGFVHIAEVSRLCYDYQQKLPAAPSTGLPQF